MHRVLLPAGLALLVPRVVLACPQCAGRDNGGIAVGIMIASMIVLPFLIAAVVYKIIKSGHYSTDLE